MAKRGYRGKHPNNDMKVAPTSYKAANYAKLTDEYNKTGAKNKYDYIKSHDGFYPQGSTTIVCAGSDAWDTGTLTLISTDGTSKVYTGATAGETAASRLFDSDVSATLVGESICNCINYANGHGGKISCSSDTGTITLTQVEPGPDGNTIVADTLTGGTINSPFTGG